MLTCCAWTFPMISPSCGQTDLQTGNVLHIYLHSQFLFIKSDTCLASWHNCFPESDSSLLANSWESSASSWCAMGGSPSHPKSRAIAPIHWHTAVLHDKRIIYMKQWNITTCSSCQVLIIIYTNQHMHIIKY